MQATPAGINPCFSPGSVSVSNMQAFGSTILEELLISSDLGVDTTLSLIEKVRSFIGREHISDPAKLKDILCDELKRMLNGNQEQKLFDLDFTYFRGS